LVLSARAGGFVRVVRLGDLRLRSGFYVYVGSALGPGGVRARLAHHMKKPSRPHWHIDYLRKHAVLEEVWYCYDRTPWEHEWARHIRMARGASVPLAGFGASDCRCESHLYFFESHPLGDRFIQSLRASGRRHPQVRLLSLGASTL
jgi:Uri superfamily endonuclease